MRDILYFVEHYVPLHLFDLETAAPQQIALLLAVQKSVEDPRAPRYFIVRAPRKGGKTILVAIVNVWLTLRDQTYRVFILSGSEAQATWLYKYCKKILWPSGPRYAETRNFFRSFLVREPMVTLTEYKAGGFIMYSAASSKKVNAPTADCLVDDEYVLIPSNIIEEAWPMIGASTDPRRFILSTATADKENTDAFIDMLDDVEPGQPLYKLGWRKFEWERKDCFWLNTDVAMRDAESASYFLSEDMFHTQIIGGLPKKVGRIFPRTFIREAFIAPDPNNPGYLLDGTRYNPEDPKKPGFHVDGAPYDPRNVGFMGDSKGGIDWGFDHDTVFLGGFRGLDHKMVLLKIKIGSGVSPSGWAQEAEDWKDDFNIEDWYADAAGAFQNQEIKDRSIRVTRRAFQHTYRGKEWMIGITYRWLSMRAWIIPDTPEFEPLKKQLLKWKRGADGKPKKGNDHCCDAFIVLNSGWDPRYYTEKKIRQPKSTEVPHSSANDWANFTSSPQGWMPPSWNERRRELTRNLWEK